MTIVGRFFAALWAWLNNHPFPASPPARTDPRRWMWTDDDDADFADFVRSSRRNP